MSGCLLKFFQIFFKIVGIFSNGRLKTFCGSVAKKGKVNCNRMKKRVTWPLWFSQHYVLLHLNITFQICLKYVNFFSCGFKAFSLSHPFSPLFWGRKMGSQSNCTTNNTKFVRRKGSRDLYDFRNNTLQMCLKYVNFFSCGSLIIVFPSLPPIPPLSLPSPPPFILGQKKRRSVAFVWKERRPRGHYFGFLNKTIKMYLNVKFLYCEGLNTF